MSLLSLKLKVTHGVNTLLGVVRSLMGSLQARSFNFLFFSFENTAGTKSILQQIEKCS